jgi:hypothetical protein
MKHILAALLMCFIVAACSDNTTPNAVDNNNNSTVTAPSEFDFDGIEFGDKSPDVAKIECGVAYKWTEVCDFKLDFPCKKLTRIDAKKLAEKCYKEKCAYYAEICRTYLDCKLTKCDHELQKVECIDDYTVRVYITFAFQCG